MLTAEKGAEGSFTISMLLNDKTSDQCRPTHRVSVAPRRNLRHTVRDVLLKERDEKNVKSRSPVCAFFLCSFSADLDSLLLALLLLSLSFSSERAERRGFELWNNLSLYSSQYVCEYNVSRLGQSQRNFARTLPHMRWCLQSPFYLKKKKTMWI